MSNYDELQRRTAERWASAYTEQNRLQRALDDARGARDKQQNAVENIEKDLKKFVGGNIRKKLYRTEHGFVLVTYREGDLQPYTTVELIDTV